MMPAANDNGFKPVTFTFRNIGPVKNAEMELGDLTIIAGRNNTGKTYLAYTLYSFLKTWLDWPGPAPPATRRGASAPSRLTARYPVFEQVNEQVAENAQAELPVDRDSLTHERKEVMKTLTREFSDAGLAWVFSSPPEKFESASVGVKLTAEFSCNSQPVKDFPKTGDTPSIRYDGANLFVIGDQPESKRRHPLALRRSLWRRYLRFLFPELPSEPFVLSAERFGISLFYRELDFQKAQLVDLLQKYGDRKGRDRNFPFVLIDETVSRYARPVKDNIDYTRSIPDLRKQKSDIHDDGFLKGIKKMMNGYYAASSDAIEFRSVARGERRFVLPLHLASSSARGLSDLYFFLRHTARRNHLLIIDEPESHLDTANQILLARLLAHLVQAGLKVLMTTHSDYIVKEINNLIMLSHSFEKKAEVMRRLKYAEDDYIAPERIRSYIAEKGSLTPCEIDQYGIDMPNFDETINGINDAANELASRLTEGSD